MRFLMKIEMPTAAENPAINAPDFNDRMRALLGQINAERASFSVTNGRRVDHIIVNVADPTELPAKAAPFHAWLQVKAEFFPEMTAEEAAKLKPRFDAVKRLYPQSVPSAPVAKDLDSFLRGEVEGRDFRHADHVRTGFEILKRHDFPAAAQAYAAALKVMTGRTGNPYAYHETMTMAFLALIAERAQGHDSYETFAAANPDLFDKSVLTRWYSPERLHSDLARRTFVLPDRAG